MDLNLIKKFWLNFNHKFKIYQTVMVHRKPIEKEITSNYSETENSNFSIDFTERITNENLEIKLKLQKLFKKYNAVFFENKYDVWIIKTEKCIIELTNNVPINLRRFRCLLKEQETLNEQIKNLLNDGLKKKSTSFYAFLVTLVNKKDESEKSHICIDFQKLNAVTITNSNFFLRIKDNIDQLHDCKIFSILDLSFGFWHVRMHPKDIYKTAFVTQFKHFELLVMPFGLRNSPFEQNIR